MRILITDDSKLIQTLLVTLLKKWGHEVLIAEDGLDAWEILQREPIQFLISDRMMPGMDGLTLCRKIRAANFPNYIYIILLTAISSKESLVEGLEAGADDYLAKPFNAEELRVRILAGARVLQLEAELKVKNDKLNDAYKIIQRDLEGAAKMQRSLLPPHSMTIGNVYFEWLLLPVTFVAGDILNYFKLLDEQHVAFYHLDVSGHGVPSAMLSVTLAKLIANETKPNNSLHLSVTAPLNLPFKDRREGRGQRMQLASPDVVVSNLNKVFQADSENDMYFTMVYGTLDMLTGELQFCQAGHPSPAFLPVEGEVRLVGEGGFPVGMLPDVSFDTYTLQLKPGDRLFLYSDGVTECSHGTSGELFGEERLVAWLTENRKLTLSELKNALEEKLLEWRGSKEFEDDVSLLALEFNPPNLL